MQSTNESVRVLVTANRAVLAEVDKLSWQLGSGGSAAVPATLLAADNTALSLLLGAPESGYLKGSAGCSSCMVSRPCKNAS